MARAADGHRVPPQLHATERLDERGGETTMTEHHRRESIDDLLNIFSSHAASQEWQREAPWKT